MQARAGPRRHPDRRRYDLRIPAAGRGRRQRRRGARQRAQPAGHAAQHAGQEGGVEPAHDQFLHQGHLLAHERLGVLHLVHQQRGQGRGLSLEKG